MPLNRFFCFLAIEKTKMVLLHLNAHYASEIKNSQYLRNVKNVFDFV
jgi:hypothetical protein